MNHRRAVKIDFLEPWQATKLAELANKPGLYLDVEGHQFQITVAPLQTKQDARNFLLKGGPVIEEDWLKGMDT